MTPEEAARAFIETEYGAAFDAEIDALAGCIRRAVESEREWVARLATEGYRCANCGVIFLTDDGHSECGKPEWASLTVNDVASAVRARTAARSATP